MHNMNAVLAFLTIGALWASYVYGSGYGHGHRGGSRSHGYGPSKRYPGKVHTSKAHHGGHGHGNPGYGVARLPIHRHQSYSYVNGYNKHDYQYREYCKPTIRDVLYYKTPTFAQLLQNANLTDTLNRDGE